MTIAFIHVPKTGGLSLRESLLKNNIDFYYDNHKYMEQVFKINNNFEFVSFFRDPLEVAISGYHFMKRHEIIHDKNLYPIDYLLSQRIKNGMKLEDYIEEYPSNIIYKRFIGKEYLKHFKFIGDTSQYSKSIKLFNRMFDLNLEEFYVNENPQKSINEKYNIKIDTNRFVNNNSIDYEIYNLGIEKFDSLCSKYLN